MSNWDSFTARGEDVSNWDSFTARVNVCVVTNLTVKDNNGCFSFNRFHDSNASWFFLPSQLLHPHRYREYNTTAIKSFQLKHTRVGPILIQARLKSFNLMLISILTGRTHT